jgi:hypothetical protein
MVYSPTSSNNPLSEKVKAFRGDKNPVGLSTLPVIVLRHFYHFQQCVSYAEWSNLARDDVWRLRMTPPSVSFLVGWLVGWLARGLLITLMMKTARTSETLVNFYQTTRRYNSEDNHLPNFQ